MDEIFENNYSDKQITTLLSDFIDNFSLADTKEHAASISPNKNNKTFFLFNKFIFILL